MAESFYQKYWDRQREAVQLAKGRKQVIVRRVGTRVQVVAPYHEDFRIKVKAIEGARWRHRTGVWSVPEAGITALRLALWECYGFNMKGT